MTEFGPSPTPSSGDADGLVGRGQELARLGRFVGQGHAAGAALLLEGAAGIGKTTLWQAGVEGARKQGYRVLECTLTMSESQLAFAGLADLVAGVFDEIVPGIAEPQQAALAGALLLTSSVDTPPPDERAVAFGMLGLLRALAAETRVLVAVDDLQWLDRSSAAMLSFAARRLRNDPVKLLLARRLEDGSDPDPLQLERSGLPFERMTVGPLTLGALHRLLGRRLGHPFTRPQLARILTASSGNPLHALELARTLDTQDPIAPGSLSSLLRARVLKLPEPTRQALALMSLAADSTLATLSRAGVEHAAERLAPAVADQLISVAGDRVRLVHPLVATAAVSVLSEEERRHAHGMLAVAASSEDERARHLGQSTAEPDEAIASTLEETALEAHRRGARAASAELYEEAARLTPSDDPANAGRRLTEAGQAFYEAGDADRAQHLLRTAVDRLPESGQRVEARWRLGIVLDETGDWLGASDVWRQALAVTDDPRLIAEIHRSMAYYALYTRSAGVAGEHSRSALDAATQYGEPRLIAYALGACALTAAIAGDESAGAYVERALDVEQSGAMNEWSPSAVAAEVARLTGHIVDSRERYARVYEWAIETGDVSVEQWAAFGLTATELLAGNYSRATVLVQTVVDIADQTRVMRIPAAMMHASVKAHLGELEAARAEGEAALTAAREAGERLHELNVLHVLAFVETSAGRMEAAHETYEEARLLAAELGARYSSVLRASLYEAEAAASAGRIERAQVALKAFDDNAMADLPGWMIGIELRARGAVETANDDLAGARATLERAAAAAGVDQAPLEDARTRLALGIVCRRLRDYSGARTQLLDSHATFLRLGAVVWAQRAAEEVARIPGRRSSNGTALTEAESRIAELVAEGRSNKDVALLLSVSVKTIESALTRIYRKLDISSRTQLAARARTQRDDAPIT